MLEHARKDYFRRIQLILMQVPDASAQRDPQFDTIDLALPFIAAAVLCVGLRIDDDMASIIILISLVILCSRARVGEYDKRHRQSSAFRYWVGDISIDIYGVN